MNFEKLKKMQLDKMLTQQYLKYKNSDMPEWESASLENIKGLKNILGQKRDEIEWNKFLENTEVSDNFRNVNIVNYIPWMEKYIEARSNR